MTEAELAFRNDEEERRKAARAMSKKTRLYCSDDSAERHRAKKGSTALLLRLHAIHPEYAP
jgi:hypothetical protein